MKVAYLDCFAGISGDMLVGAMVDAGLPLEHLQEQLDKLNLTGWQIDVKQVKKRGIIGTKFNVILEQHHHHSHRNLEDICQIINASMLATPIKEQVLKIFARLAKAEAKVHGTTVENIHFHEVGALDAIIDIVAISVGFHWLGVEEIICSPLMTGRGYVHCAHGTIPVPAPATVELLAGIPYQQGNIDQELVTPTGAAVVATLCSEFRPLPEMISEHVGYGAGQRDLEIPNLLRLHIGKKNHASSACIIETNIDDMNPEFYQVIMEKLFNLGAWDVYISPVVMKKNRPGCVLHILAPLQLVKQLGQVVLEQTTALGYRYYPVTRHVLEREFIKVDTGYGKVRVKVARQGHTVMNIAPEYTDCLELAQHYQLPVKHIYNLVIKNSYSALEKEFRVKERSLYDS